MRRLSSVLIIAALVSTQTLSAAGVASASHDGGAPHSGSSDLPTLVAALAETNQRVADIGSDIQAKQEGFNKTLVEVASAREALVGAQRDVAESEQALVDSQTAIAAARQRFNQFAASTYMNGPSPWRPLQMPNGRSPRNKQMSTGSWPNATQHEHGSTLRDLRA